MDAINQHIADNYLNIPIKRMAKILERSDCLVRGRMIKMGLEVPKELAEARKKESNYKKGDNPWNAGRKDLRVSPKTEFKKGSLPANTLHDGAITVRNNRSSKTGKLRQYKYIRISKAKWILYQRKVWQDANGPIPKGYNVQFIDGYSLNCSLENLYIISRKEQAVSNHNYDKASQTHLLKREEDGYQTPSEKLTDNYVASLVVGPNKQEQEALIKYHPHIIEVKRTVQQLNRKIKEVQNGKAK